MKNIYRIIITLFICLFIQQTKAQDFVFTFVNPAFGGNPYNYSWLLQSADKQNKYDKQEENFMDMLNMDPLNNFEDNLNNSIMNQLINKISEDIFGQSQSLTPGYYELGRYNVRIVEKLSGLAISITDQLSGNSTNLFIPNSPSSNNQQP